MIKIFYVLLLIISIVGFILLSLGKSASGSIILGISVAFALIVSIVSYSTRTLSKEPTALDVYRGKTTLEITYRDSVAIDSTVVYKMK